MIYRMLLIVMVLGLSMAARAGAAQPGAGGAGATTRPAHEVDAAIQAFLKPMQAGDQDDDVRKKLIERHNTAVRLLELRVGGYRKGLNDVNSVFEATRLVVEAKRDLAQSVKERDQMVDQLLEVTQAMESQLEAQWKAGFGSEADLLRARLAREMVEVEQLKARRAGAGASSGAGERTGATPTTRPGPTKE